MGIFTYIYIPLLATTILGIFNACTHHHNSEAARKGSVGATGQRRLARTLPMCVCVWGGVRNATPAQNSCCLYMQDAKDKCTNFLINCIQWMKTHYAFEKSISHLLSLCYVETDCLLLSYLVLYLTSTLYISAVLSPSALAHISSSPSDADALTCPFNGKQTSTWKRSRNSVSYITYNMSSYQWAITNKISSSKCGPNFCRNNITTVCTFTWTQVLLCSTGFTPI